MIEPNISSTLILPDIAAVAEVGLGTIGVADPLGIECFKYSFTLDDGGNIFIRASKRAGSFLLNSLPLDFVDGTEKIMFLSWNEIGNNSLLEMFMKSKGGFFSVKSVRINGTN